MRVSPVRLLLALLALALGAAVLAGCGSDAGGGTTASTAGPAIGGSTTGTDGMVTGVATCDRASIEQAVADTGTAQKTTATLSQGGYRCADGWAVAFADVGPPATATTQTLIFEAEGQFWIPQDPAKVCPKPSTVPAAIYAKACKTN